MAARLLALFAAAGGLACMTGSGAAPTLGARDGRLAPLPRRPNAVSSQADDPGRRVAPLHYAGDADAAWHRLRSVVEAMPRSRVVREESGYLHAEFTSRIFRFVDDLELLLDEDARVIHVRSASRVGHSDLGANRRRVEALRRAFESDVP